MAPAPTPCVWPVVRAPALPRVGRCGSKGSISATRSRADATRWAGFLAIIASSRSWYCVYGSGNCGIGSVTCLKMIEIWSSPSYGGTFISIS